MSDFQNFIPVILKWFLPIFAIAVLILFVYNWKRRWLYYHGAKIPGPFAFPLIGSIHLFEGGPYGMHKFFKKLYRDYPDTFKIWLGPDLYITTTDANHLKTILTKFLDKGEFYSKMAQYFHRALAAAPVNLWKKNRKNINPTFNVTLINSFIDAFNKHGRIFTEDFEKVCGLETGDIFADIWKCTLDAACETLAGVDPNLIRTGDYLDGVLRLENILIQRFFNPFHYLDIFWYFSSLKKELLKLWKQNCSCIQKMIDLMKPEEKDVSTKKRFLAHLVDSVRNKEVPHDYILEEGQIMFFVGTETSAVVLSSFLVILGIYPHLQDRIDEEFEEIFHESDRDATLDDVNRMNYLERMIKETMRFLPPIPMTLRGIDEDIQIDSYVFPKGARIIVPIMMVHRNPKYWPDPMKFDPDRFLPEESDKRPPCSYIPFSYGIRNCIGYKYGMLSMKVILSRFLRTYRVKSSNFKSIEDIDLIIHVVAKPKKGYKITVEKKEK